MCVNLFFFFNRGSRAPCISSGTLFDDQLVVFVFSLGLGMISMLIWVGLVVFTIIVSLLAGC